MARDTFTVLGEVSASLDGRSVVVSARRARSVLALLLTSPRQVVSADRLVDEVWGDVPLDSGRASLQVLVSRLRSTLEPERPRGEPPRLLVSSGNGYALMTEPGAIDAERFAALVARAEELLAAGHAGDGLAACQEAQALWRGAPYPDVDGETVAAEAARLEGLRLRSVELHAAAQIDLGRPGLVAVELEPFVAAHPFREHAWELLALALYRSGRQADALDAVRRARTALLEELGVDPSPALRELETALLEQDPALLVGAAVQAGAGTVPLRPAADVPAATPAREQVGGGLVGRAEVLRRLGEHVDQLSANRRGGVVVVTGEAGIGKTRLATALAAAAEAQGLAVLWGRCHEADVSPAYWPWIPVVRDLAGPSPSPQVASLLSADLEATVLDAESAALRTYDAVARLVREAARERPLVLVLEDLHWADTASLQLLAYAAELWHDAPVLVLATVRMPESAPPGLQACLAALARAGALRVHLDGLDEAAVRALTASITSGPVAEDLAEVLAARTDGNPFFVIELVRLLAGEHRLDADAARSIAVPHGVSDVLRLRLARLPEDVHALLVVAAVGGREFRLDLLAEVAGLTTDATLELVELALAAAVIEEDELPGRYRFSHALVRETLAESLSRTRRGRLHADYGRVLEQRLADDADLVEEVAHHLVLGAALDPALAGPGTRHAVAAARRAEARGAFDRARVHWEQARTADALARESDPSRRFDVLLGLGRARYRQGDVAGSREVLDEAVRIAAALGEVDRVAEAATSFRGAGVWHWREFGTVDVEMIAVLEDCLERLPDGSLRARVLASLAMELVYAWRSAEADACSTQALVLARRLGEPSLLADVAALRCLALFGRPGAAGERLQLAEEILALPISQEEELYARFNAACAWLQLGRAAEADLQMARAVELARRLRHTGADVPLAWWAFWRAHDSGRAEAVELLHSALDRHRRSSIVSLPEMEFHALRVTDPHAATTPEQLEAVRHSASPAIRAQAAHLLVECGRAAEALDVLGDPVPLGAWDYASMFADCLRVEVFALAGALEQVPEALARIEPWQDEFAVYGSTECAGSVAYFVGVGREALGDREAARAAYARAVAANRAAGIHPWLARAERRPASTRPTPVGASAAGRRGARRGGCRTRDAHREAGAGQGREDRAVGEVSGDGDGTGRTVG